MLCCSNTDGTYRKGAFESTSSGNSDKGRGFIPWIWSRQVQEAYHFGPILGEGAYAIVHEAVTLAPPHDPYAIKVVPRNRLMNSSDLRHFKDEILILLDLQHEHIIQLHELYKTRDYFFLVMEKINGGELFDRLCENEILNEKEARDIMRTVFDAMSFCHEQQVAHRDLKPENLLLTTTGDDAKVKIADFGFAKRVARPNSLSTRCGSPAYMAPGE